MQLLILYSRTSLFTFGNGRLNRRIIDLIEPILKALQVDVGLLMPIFKMIEYIGGTIGSIAIIWKFFGPKIKRWITNLTSELINDALKNQKESLDLQISKLNERITLQEKTDMNSMGYTILKECKAAMHSGRIGELEYSHLCTMYSHYKYLGGNGVVKRIWDVFLEKVEVK